MTDAAMIPVIYLLTVGFLLLLPDISRGDVLFGVRFTPGVRHTEMGLHHLRIYRLQLLVVAVLAAIPLKLWHDERAFAASLCGLGAFSLFLFYLRWRVVRLQAPPTLPVREAALAESSENIARWYWLLLPAALILAAAALHLYLHWENIPPIIPTHWNVHGQPDHWAPRTVRTVFGPLIMGAVMTLWVALLSLAILFGARRTEARRPLVAVILACADLTALLFSATALLPLLHFPVWLMLGVPLAFIVGCIGWALWLVNRLRTSSEPTPNECWYVGMFYYNPQDPAIFVEKRVGIGYTMNFANPLAWLLMGGLLLMIFIFTRLIGPHGG